MGHGKLHGLLDLYMYTCVCALIICALHGFAPNLVKTFIICPALNGHGLVFINVRSFTFLVQTESILNCVCTVNTQAAEFKTSPHLTLHFKYGRRIPYVGQRT
jgi:hypothetical protein